MKRLIALITFFTFLSLLCGCKADKITENQVTERTAERSTNVAETTIKIDNMGSSVYSNDKVVWGPGRAENHDRPSEPLTLQQRYGELGAQFIMSDEKFICLTFDEGYENGFTPAILDVLKDKEVKAIFFVTYDFVRDNPKLIERMIDEGHIIGNHTWRHYTMDEVSTQTATEEVMLLDDYMKKNFRYRMKLFRFPKGEFSESTLDLVNQLGYKSVFWSFAYADWDTQNQTDSKSALDEITNHMHNGEIMLLHAVSSTNAEILPEVIDSAREQGYEFTTEV